MKKKTENIPEKTIRKTKAKPVQKPKKPSVVQKKKSSKGEEMTPMQEKAVKKLAEKVGKGGKIVLAKVLQEAGYSPGVTNTPSKVF